MDTAFVLRCPDPRQHGILIAPLGQGCYEVRDGNQLVLFGQGGHVAFRMTSLLPNPMGCGSRDNRGKREYILKRLGTVENRTLACVTKAEAKYKERELQSRKSEYLFRD